MSTARAGVHLLIGYNVIPAHVAPIQDDRPCVPPRVDRDLSGRMGSFFSTSKNHPGTL